MVLLLGLELILNAQSFSLNGKCNAFYDESETLDMRRLYPCTLTNMTKENYSHFYYFPSSFYDKTFEHSLIFSPTFLTNH